MHKKDLFGGCDESKQTIYDIQATNYDYNAKTQVQINKLISQLNDKLTNNKDYPYILDSRINMTRLVPQFRVLHISQPV